MSSANIVNIVVISVVTILIVGLLLVLFSNTAFRLRVGNLLTIDATIRERLGEAVDSLEDRQYALIKEYHSRSLAQSVQSFWFGLITAATGFVVIISGIVVGIVHQGVVTPIIQVASGTVIEAVSGLFFVQSNKARELLVAFFDKLREDRKLDEAIRFAREMEHGVMRQRLQTALAASFSGSVDQALIAQLCNAESHQQPVNGAVAPARGGAPLRREARQPVNRDGVAVGPPGVGPRGRHISGTEDTA